MPIPSRRIASAVSGHKKKIQSKPALKRAREMVEKWGPEEKPKPKPKPKAATEAGGTVLEEGRRMGIYKKAKPKKKKKTTTSAGTWNKGRWFNTRSV